MGSKAKYDLRVTIDANDSTRVLFSVKDPPNGKFLIARKAPDTLRPVGLNVAGSPGIQQLLPRVKEQHYSIHPSNDPNGNFLKATTLALGDEKLCYRQFTKVIKSRKNFSPTFIQRCPRLDRPTFDLKSPGGQQVSLGKYDPRHFTPFFGVFIGATETEFVMPTQGLPMPINIIQHQFRNIRMVILWSFVALPSHQSGLTFLFVTSKETPELTEGFTADHCCYRFFSECWKMEEELRNFIYIELGGEPGARLFYPAIRYFADGATLTPRAAQYMDSLKTQFC